MYILIDSIGIVRPKACFHAESCFLSCAMTLTCRENSERKTHRPAILTSFQLQVFASVRSGTRTPTLGRRPVPPARQRGFLEFGTVRLAKMSVSILNNNRCVIFLFPMTANRILLPGPWSATLAGCHPLYMYLPTLRYLPNFKMKIVFV